MPNIESIIQSGMGNPWLLLPLAIVLGALHALEPGHSKSMMTAFIVAVQGTTRQAVLLGLAATVGHTIVVWALALLAWRISDKGVLERAEPWLLLIGGALLIWLSWRIISRLGPMLQNQAHGHSHGHSHTAPHDHHGHSHSPHAHDHRHDQGREHSHGHAHGPHHHDHGPMDDDAHAAYHAAEVQKRFANRSTRVTDSEVAWFGFTGGLLPCPAAFAVLLACLHQQAYGLGVVMVAAFSIGLAAMMVSIGVAAAWGASALTSRVSGFSRLASWAPYVSAGVVLMVGLVTMAQGLSRIV